MNPNPLLDLDLDATIALMGMSTGGETLCATTVMLVGTYLRTVDRCCVETLWTASRMQMPDTVPLPLMLAEDARINCPRVQL